MSSAWQKMYCDRLVYSNSNSKNNIRKEREEEDEDKHWKKEENEE